MKIILRNKTLWMGNAIIAASLATTLFFPAQNGIQAIITALVFLVIMPTLFVRWFLKRPLAEFGITRGNVFSGSVWLCVLLVGVVAVYTYAYYATNIFADVSMPFLVRSDFSFFLIYAGILGTTFLIQEFFFRGFMTALWRPTFGSVTVLLQALLATLFPLAQSGWYISPVTPITFVLSLGAGWVAYQSRSIWFSFFFFFFSVILGITYALVFGR